ncbi:hypothetical protein LAC81_27165 [Ensifer adhaerens]|uniref:hypothetical protein n=1 Tax=Ensifer adhaerens TaxID=106592 RepID=UPI001CBD70A4|nr:hypothetical protein [Ensifer adhaerens]MBZ7924412.1 hypothetical protein [Ensifer adhaerens]UAX96343.1 hypothetical protein LAC78_21315 [Ensifer adhaerens]UAY04314.1 hypothetical protein LAC80_23645 [Ensifer adhaerens]UAY12299.1 hypothetical protein LAC81_27165 [Ensifer adhaerens]
MVHLLQMLAKFIRCFESQPAVAIQADDLKMPAFEKVKLKQEFKFGGLQSLLESGYRKRPKFCERVLNGLPHRVVGETSEYGDKIRSFDIGAAFALSEIVNVDLAARPFFWSLYESEANA